MITIGMLHHRKEPQDVVKSYAYAAVAKAEGAELLYFSPKAVDFENNLINGYMYQNGSWIKVQSPFPHVIYNAGSPRKLAKSSDIIRRLKKEIPFTTYSIGNKVCVYNRLKEAQIYNDYLIPSEKVSTVENVIASLKQHHKIVFKPVSNHQGQGVTFIEKKKRGFHLLVGTESYMYTLSQLNNFISQRLQEEDYLVQPYISCKTKSGQSFVIRLHVQKNGEGKWVNTAIYPSISPVGSIVSNICSGSSTNQITHFLLQEYGEGYYDIIKYLEQFALQLANHMDDLQQDHFDETLDELGIDIGLDENRKIWIYEVNWRPGCPPSFYLELDVVRNQIRYAMYLYKEQVTQKD